MQRLCDRDGGAASFPGFRLYVSPLPVVALLSALTSLHKLFFIWLLAVMSHGCLGDARLETSGIVIDASGKAVALASVSLTPTAESDCDVAPVSNTSNVSGQFFLGITFSPNVRNAEFMLKVSKEGYKSFNRRIKNSESNVYNIIITLEKGK